MPREGHDTDLISDLRKIEAISIHVPREGHDNHLEHCQSIQVAFQSTCPARGTTFGKIINISQKLISIHVPREGHDNCYCR